MSKFAQGEFVPQNPDKYVGLGRPRYRSGWELSFMNFCDNNKNIIKWASESIRIPYQHPLTGKQTIYVPDFLVQYLNKKNQICTEVVEIKPKKQSIIESKASNRERMTVAVNYAKWAAAQAWCKRQGLVFRVVTEGDIFYQGGRR